MIPLTRLILIPLLIAAPVTPVAADEAAEILFATRVVPLLKQKCLACHGDDAKDLRGELDLRSLAATLRGGESGSPSVVPGKPLESPLYLAALRTHDDWSAMPPKENDKLTAAQLDLLRTWIKRGAAWPAAERVRELVARASPESAGVRVATSGGLSKDWTGRSYPEEQLWAYRPVQPVPVPPGAEHPIDAFLNVKLQNLGLDPAPQADRRTLLRRVAFDMLGLPPTPEELESFLADPADDDAAWGRVIDRLLASPHYGEQSARHWLDITRYADSSGFANDYERGTTWRYRDYVVRAFQQDRSYDQFVREQIAGDEIDPDAPELLVATGFLRMGPWELTGMEVARIARQRFLDDVTDSVGQVFLAHPLQCARCHDHKFDPVPTRDYYSLQAVFATTQLVERPAAFLPQENTSGFDERQYLELRRQRYEADLRGLAEREDAAGRTWCAERDLEYVSRAEGLKRGLPEDRLPPRHVGLSPADLGLERIARKGLERLKWELDRYEPVAWSVYSGPTPELKSVSAPQRMPGGSKTKSEIEASAILIGGDPFSPGPAVTPGVLSAAMGLTNGSPDGTINAALFASTDRDVPVAGRRRALANWIASPNNPLTARVMVNRLWQQHFGRGLAGNPNNFGATGKRPTHPELLDWLAGEFVLRDWSIKAMHRLILTSSAYRRSSVATNAPVLQERDPDGSAYAVFRPRRLAAEELRDSMLVATGELNPELGGIPVRPEMNLDAALQPRQVMGTFAPAWQPSPLPRERHRRSLYALRLRGLPDPFFELFNQPTGENSCEAREASTIASQVFALFNSQATLDRAVALAARLDRESAGRDVTIDRAFQLTLQRLPRPDERDWCLAHWQEMARRHAGLNLPRTAVPREIVREAVEENTGEPFTFTEVLDAVADFEPDLQAADVSADLRGLAEVCLVLLNSNEFVWID